jgi:hypothetical protein
MDEEENFEAGKTGQTRGTVRPSMVVMTSKLLHVSEGIAAMNLRIAAGVVFCMILLVATFVVNVVAFDYAKDQEQTRQADGSFMVTDKSSGEVVDFHTKYAVVQKDFTEVWLSIKEISVHFNAEAMGEYTVQAAEMYPCPVAQAEHCYNGNLYVFHTTAGRVFTYNGLFHPTKLSVVDPVYEEAAFGTSVGDRRKLLGQCITGYWNARCSSDADCGEGGFCL